jgi:predicted dinucleotide-binding enzyme
MSIGVIGTRAIGSAIAEILSRAGIDVTSPTAAEPTRSPSGPVSSSSPVARFPHTTW